MTITTTTTMNAELKGQFDKLEFVVNPDQNKYMALLGDDTDSFVGSMYLKEISGITVGGFYDFDNIYVSSEMPKNRKFIGIDMSFITDGHKCWDNHIQLGSADDSGNNTCANINIFNNIHAETKTDYHKKYAGSTALQMYAYYDGSKPKTVEGAMAWLCIDSAFKGHYSDSFKRVNNAYFEQLGLTWAIDVLSKYSYQEMVNFMSDYGMNSKIKLNNQGELYNVGKFMKSPSGQWLQGKALNMDFLSKHLGFQIELPKESFLLLKELERVSMKKNDIAFKELDKSQIVSMAYTYTNQIELTKYKNN